MINHEDTRPIRVGIIGGSRHGWASVSHIPALASIPGFELTAVSTTNKDSAQEAAEAFGAKEWYDDAGALASSENVDLVVVAVRTPFHRDSVLKAIAAGKSVYCEWPLGLDLAEATELADAARSAGVYTAIGTQGRSAPAVQYVRDLIAEGYVGEVLSSTIVGSGVQWGDVTLARNAYTLDHRNGSNMTTIPFSHALDTVTHVLGELTEVSATAAIRIPRVRASDGDQTYEKTTPDQLIIAGTLESGAVLSAHYRGGLSRGTKLLWEINGTDGDLQLVGDYQLQLSELTVSGARGDDKELATLEVPARYRQASPSLPIRVANIGEAYLRVEADLRTGSRTAPSFDDAVTRHRMVEAVLEAARSGQRQTLREEPVQAAR